MYIYDQNELTLKIIYKKIAIRSRPLTQRVRLEESLNPEIDKTSHKSPNAHSPTKMHTNAMQHTHTCIISINAPVAVCTKEH